MIHKKGSVTRTINEDKAMKMNVRGAILLFISLLGLGIAGETNLFINLSSIIGAYLGGIMLCNGFYSLGWEYKRLSMMQESGE